jgi:serine/threonine-protein kinase HipA
VTDELVVLLDGREAGRVHNDRGRLTFVYDDDWRNAADAYQLSLSMPLAAKEHGRAVIDAYLWGLLPDNERVLDRWAARFHVSARNAFALISHVGEDCAGAIQFVTPDRLATIRSGKEDNVEWLDEADIAKRLQALRADHAAWRLPHDTGQFSLSGAQPRRHCFFRTAAGVFRPADCRRPTFSSPRPAISTGTRKTSTSV